MLVIPAARDNFGKFVGGAAGHCTMTFDTARGNAEFDDWLIGMLDGSTPAAMDCGSGCVSAGVVGCDGVVGSGMIEDRCAVCDGDDLSCPMKEGVLCTCAGVVGADGLAAAECNVTLVAEELDATSIAAGTPILAGATYSRWDGIPGTDMASLLADGHYLWDPPDGFSILLDFCEAPVGVCDSCATELEAYFRPTLTGDFVFFLSADDNAHLWFGETT